LWPFSDDASPYAALHRTLARCASSLAALPARAL
jgi:hypothetical protein